jgi:hypothetical protein
MCCQGSGANEGVRDRVLRENRSDAFEQRHEVSGLFAREVTLPAARARLNTLRASVSLT